MTERKDLAHVYDKIKSKPEEIIIRGYPVPDKIGHEDIFLKSVCLINGIVQKKYDDLEWMGYILAKKENPTIATDVMIEKQRNEEIGVGISPEAKFEVIKRLERNRPDHTIIGVVHYFNALHGFSSDDVRDIMKTARGVAFNTEKIWKLVDLRLRRLGLLTVQDDEKSLISKDYDVLSSVPMEDLKERDLSYILKITRDGETPLSESGVKDLQLFLPYRVGWCYNMIVCADTKPDSKENINKCISVVEGLDLFPKKDDLFKPIELDDPILTEKEPDVEYIEAEIKRCVTRPYSLARVAKKTITSLFRKPGKEKTPRKVETTKVTKGTESVAKKEEELYPENIYRFVGTVISNLPRIDAKVVEEFEKVVGFKLLDKETVSKIQAYAEAHPDITSVILGVCGSKTPYQVERALRRYKKK